MKTKLIWITPDAEKTIAYCARVSNPQNQSNPNISKLINYCIDHGHWSIFEMANMCIEIETSRAIAAQILRHRSFSFQEFSQRYQKIQDFEDIYLRKQDEKNRQASHDNLPEETKKIFNEEYQKILQKTQELYENMLNQGVAKECARMILPLNTKTKMYMNGSIRSWIHYLNLRTGQDTQKEHRDIADSIKKIFIINLPIISSALEWL